MDTVLLPKEFLLLWTGSVIVMIGTAVIVRREQRLPFLKPHLPYVVFGENWCSGASSLGLLGAFGWAGTCLWVVLTETSLHVGLHFPFNLVFPRVLVGLDLSIPVSSLVAVETVQSFLIREHIKVTYTVEDRSRGVVRTEYVALQLKSSPLFVRKLEELISHRKASGAVSEQR